MLSSGLSPLHEHRELVGNVDRTVPVVIGVLIAGQGDLHFWQTFPSVNFNCIIVEAYKPVVGPRAKRKHGEFVAEFVEAPLQRHTVRGPAPHQLTICIE